MKTSPLFKAVRRALLPVACITLLSACAPYYDPVSGTVVNQPPPFGAPIDNPTTVFERLDTNRDGYLSRGEVEVLGVARAAPPPPVDVTVSFQRLDMNRDGFLSREEAAATMSSIPGATFDQIDANRDGFLSMAEAAPHLRWLESRGTATAAAWFDQLDANRDGFLSRAEAEPMLRSTRFVGGRWEVGPFGAAVATFDQLDINRDGYLSRAEASAVIASPATFDQHDSNRDGFLSRAEADVLLRSGVGVTYPPYGGGSVYGPR